VKIVKSRASRPRKLALGLVAALAVASLAPAGPAAGVAKTKRQAQIDREIAQLREEFQEASEEEHALVGRVTEARRRQAEIDGKIAKLEGQLAAVQADVDRAQARLDEMSAQAVAAEEKLQQAEAELAEAKDVLRRRALAAYVAQSDLQVANATLISAGDERRYAATQGYLKSVVAKQREEVEAFRQLKAEAAELRESLELQRQQALLQRDEVSKQASHLEAVRAEHEVVRRDAVANQVQQSTLLGEVRASKEKVAAEIAQLKAESDSISAFLRRSQSGPSTVTPGSGALASPLPGSRVSSTFGPRTHPIFGDTRMHTGVDYAAAMGTPIRAAADGIVLSAGVRGGYGNTTLIDHGGSLATMYCHQSSFAVAAGQRVAKGQVIGYVGSTGFSTGPHLHFEVRVNGSPVNPYSYF
jgi:murein DD-endopeptidase MepM/ murein hydrolase activator NlpD